MDRHLGFLEIPQPLNPKIEVKVLKVNICPLISFQIYASGQKIKYARTFVGFANDWIYRKEVKKLLDAIIVSFFVYRIKSYSLISGEWRR